MSRRELKDERDQAIAERDEARGIAERGIERLRAAAPVIDGLTKELNAVRGHCIDLQDRNAKMFTANTLLAAALQTALTPKLPEEDGDESRTSKLDVDPDPPRGPRLVRG